ncbi:hypothetical protein BCR43DRAFT_490059 [Syncephalastrum racemosum]|uniref:F-box domain-containing protein n=1 Tax=Syncephalastrum racemosum TaxID=13706 RepID=A0A1X2HF78_SYNRA|nr:hypothetical protein BCR43DRAFT_490059 [Syncephalastrum racemosum]
MFKSPSSVCDLPLELLLKISGYWSFADLWYLGTCSRKCRTLVHQLIWHKYHIDLARPKINSFNHLVHSAVAFVSRHGYKHGNGYGDSSNNDEQIDHRMLQFVANRLSVEIYERTPQQNWQPSLDFFLDRTLGIILDHVVLDPSLDPLPNSCVSDLQHIGRLLTSGNRRRRHDAIDENDDDVSHPIQHNMGTKYAATRMGKLMTHFLVTLYPTLTAMFDDTDPACAIHHRLLLAHLSRHLDGLTHRYHQQQRRRIIEQRSLSPPSRHCLSVRHGFRVLVQFIGTLVQTDLLTATDLHILTRQRIIAFFIHNRLLPSSTHADKALVLQHHQHWRVWIEEVEFQIAVLLDLLRAVVCRQYTLWDSGKELNIFATMLNDTVSTLISSKSSPVLPESAPEDDSSLSSGSSASSDTATAMTATTSAIDTITATTTMTSSPPSSPPSSPLSSFSSSSAAAVVAAAAAAAAAVSPSR